MESTTVTAETRLQWDSCEETKPSPVMRQGAKQGRKCPFEKNWPSKRSLSIVILILSLLLLINIIIMVIFFSKNRPGGWLISEQFSPGVNTFVPWGPACPAGWIGYERKCYFFSDEKRPWTSSQSFCVSYNSSLAVIKSEPEKVFMLRYKGIAGHWIGLKKDLNQTWKWVDGTELNNTLEVKGEGGDCAFLSSGYAISSQCHLPGHWICSHPDMYIRNMTSQIV